MPKNRPSYTLFTWRNASCSKSSSRSKAACQVKKMDPKIYLLLALFSTLVISASQGSLREYARKLRLARHRKRA